MLIIIEINNNNEDKLRTRCLGGVTIIKGKIPKVNAQSFNPYIILILLILAMICTSFASLFIKFAEAPPVVIATYRMLLSTLLLTPATLATRRRELKSLRQKELLTALTSGIFLALHFYTWITSLWYTSVASSTVLVTTHPIFVLLGSHFLLKERVTKTSLLSGGVALAGAMLIGTEDFYIYQKALLGDLLAIIGAVFMSGYILIGRKLRQVSVLTYTFIVYGSSTITLLILTLVTGKPLYPYPLITWVFFFALALIPTIGGHTLLNLILKYLPAPVVSISILGEPIGATALAFLFLAEVPKIQQLIGGIFVLLGISSFILNSKKWSNL